MHLRCYSLSRKKQLDAPSVVVRLGLGLLLLLDSSCAFIPSLHPRALSPFLSPQLSTRTGCVLLHFAYVLRELERYEYTESLR